MCEKTDTIKIQICPDDEQKVLIKKTFGSCRKVYNDVLDKYKTIYENDNTVKPSMELLNKLFLQTKKELPYLDEVEQSTLENSIKDLQEALIAFFNNQNTFPKFLKKKDKTQSFKQTVINSNKIVTKDGLFLRQYGLVKFKSDLKIYGEIKTITVLEKDLKYYAILNVRIKNE